MKISKAIFLISLIAMTNVFGQSTREKLGKLEGKYSLKSGDALCASEFEVIIDDRAITFSEAHGNVSFESLEKASFQVSYSDGLTSKRCSKATLNKSATELVQYSGVGPSVFPCTAIAKKKRVMKLNEKTAELSYFYQTTEPKEQQSCLYKKLK